VARLAGGARDPRKWGLHFDLTVPFARYVLENAGHAGFPVPPLSDPEVLAWRAPAGGALSGVHPGRHRRRGRRHARPAFRGRDALVIADVFARFPVGDFVIQVNNRKLANGFYAGLGLDGCRGHAAHGRQARQDRAGGGARAVAGRGLQRRAGAQAVPATWPRSIPPTTSFVDRRCARSGCPSPLLDEGLARSGRGWSRPPPPRARQGRRRPEDRARPGLLHRHGL
jgi:hypothetical protein